MYYIVQDEIGSANVPGGDVSIGVSVLTTINTVTWVVVVPGIGCIADRLDRRKLVVALCGILLGLSLLIPVISPTYTGLIVYSICGGAFFGACMAVEARSCRWSCPTRRTRAVTWPSSQ